MQESTEVRDALLRFYELLSKGEIAHFDDVVADDAAIVIGTAPGEWVTERGQMRFGFEAEGLRIEPGAAPVGYAEGSMGWVADEPTFFFPPDGEASMKTRLTAVHRRDGDLWKMVHMHVSVGVPDEEIVELQQRWLDL